jgi:predicted peroxiredoxin
MARILSIATHATDDPTKAALAWVTAVGAIGADRECTVALVGDAVTMAKEAVAKSIHGAGFPPLPELIDKVVKASIPVFL